ARPAAGADRHHARPPGRPDRAVRAPHPRRRARHQPPRHGRRRRAAGGRGHGGVADDRRGRVVRRRLRRVQGRGRGGGRGDRRRLRRHHHRARQPHHPRHRPHQRHGAVPQALGGGRRPGVRQDGDADRRRRPGVARPPPDPVGAGRRL
ncbi:MAG: Polymer-forming bactofilin, partial [uncultured Acetobacteraceae bacterium]